MKKNECYEGAVTALRFPNKGLVEVEGEDTPVLVKNTLPGQRVSFRLKKARKSRPEGLLLDVLEPSPMENAAPPCPHFGECGGCSYQTMDYANQMALKLSQVEELMKAACPDFPLSECVASPAPWEYRNKMEFSFGDERKDGPLSLGLHKKGSFYDILPVPECRIVDEDIRMVLRVTLKYFQAGELMGKPVTFYHKMRHEGVLRHLLVRKARGTGELLICLVTTSQGGILSPEGKKLLDGYTERLRSLGISGSFAGILHMVNDSLSDVVQSDETRILYGRDFFYEKILGLEFKISPFSFFQTNSAGAEVLYGLAREYIGNIQGKTVFDLYSGTGTIAQVLAPVAEKVVGVEIVEEAVRAAEENARKNGLDNCSFLAGDVLKVLEELEETPDAIVLDPPREGVHPKALRRILSYGVETIVYISCKPTSLARDIEAFLECGYTLVRAQCVDMFPWTRGIETVVQLVNIDVKPDYTVRLEVDVEKLYSKVGEDNYRKFTREV